MTHLIQILVLGLALGGVYALMASGLTLIFGVMGIVNLAHAAFMTVAAYLSFLAFSRYGLDPIVSIVVVMPVMFLLGLAIYQLLFARSFGDPRARAMSVLLTFALALVVEGVLGFLFTNIYRSTTPGYTASALLFGPYYLPEAQCYATVMSMAILGLLWAFLQYTRTGYAVRATMQNRTAAQVVGVNVGRISHAGVRDRDGARGRVGIDDVVPVPVLSGQALGVGRGSAVARGPGRHGQPARRADRRAVPRGRVGLRQLVLWPDLVAGDLLPRSVPDPADPAAGPPGQAAGDVNGATG